MKCFFHVPLHHGVEHLHLLCLPVHKAVLIFGNELLDFALGQTGHGASIDLVQSAGVELGYCFASTSEVAVRFGDYVVAAEDCNL